jgi:dihydroorotase-like cyclic amidohydrolase
MHLERKSAAGGIREVSEMPITRSSIDDRQSAGKIETNRGDCPMYPEDHGSNGGIPGNNNTDEKTKMINSEERGAV